MISLMLSRRVTEVNERTLASSSALTRLTTEASLMASTASKEAASSILTIWSPMRAAEIVTVCPARSSTGARNEERCMMTVVRIGVSVLKDRQGAILRYKKEMEIGD